MGIIISASVLCDNCNVTTVGLDSVEAPLPSAWMRAQGYANISEGDSTAVNGYFCPDCVTAEGVKNLFKKAVDITEMENANGQ